MRIDARRLLENNVLAVVYFQFVRLKIAHWRRIVLLRRILIALCLFGIILRIHHFEISFDSKHFPIMNEVKNINFSDLSQFHSGMFILLESLEIYNVTYDIYDEVDLESAKSLKITRKLKPKHASEITAAVYLIVPKGIDNSRNLKVDQRKVVFDYIKTMIALPFAMNALNLGRQAKGRVLNIGLGGSTLNNFIHEYFPMIKITVVECEKQIIRIARKYFGLVEDENQQVVQADGILMLKNGRKRFYDVIFLDACNPISFSEQVCPSNGFIQPDVITSLRRAIRRKGVLVVNLLHNTDSEKRLVKYKEIKKLFEKYFLRCHLVDLQYEYNQVLGCTKNADFKISNEGRLQERLRIIYKELNFEHS